MPFRQMTPEELFGQAAYDPGGVYSQNVPRETSQSVGDSSWYGEIGSGFKNELVNALQIAKNVTGLVDSAAEKVSRWTGEDLPTVRSTLQSFVSGIEKEQQELAPSETGSGTVGGALLRGIGAAPVQIAEYGLATLLTKRPTLAFALVDAAREADKGPLAAAKAGAIGAAGGAALGAASKIPSLAGRAAAGAVVGGAQAKIQGGSREDIIAGSLMGGGLSSIGHERKADVQRSADGTPKLFTVRSPRKDLIPILSYLESPHAKFEHVPGAQQVTIDAVDSLARVDALSERWNRLAREAFRRNELSPSEHIRLVEALNDPQYTIASPPKGTPEFQKAFRTAREVTEEARREIVDMKRQQWVAERGDGQLPPWELKKERERLGRSLTQDEVQKLEAQRRLDLTQAAEEAIPAWGKEGYFPHLFEGNWKIVIRKAGEDGKIHEKPIPEGGWLAETKRDAELKAEQFAQRHPEFTADQIMVAPFETNFGGEFSSGKGKRYFGHAQERGANLDMTGRTPEEMAQSRHAGLSGWVQDEEALYQYLNRAARYVEMSKLRPKLRAVRDYLEEHQPTSETLKQWKAYEDRVEGRPDRLTNSINGAWVAAGGRPDVVQRASGFVRGVESLSKLGLSPVSALANLSQYGLNSVPVLGPKYALLGFKEAVRTLTNDGLRRIGMEDAIPKGKKDYTWLLKRLNLSSEAHKGDVFTKAEAARLYMPKDERLRPGFYLNMLNHYGLKLFSGAEYANRVATVIGAFERARAEGLSVEQAVRKAREVEVRTQFTYNSADAPVALSTPLARTAFQFQNFFLKQMEFLTGMATGRSQFGRFDDRKKELGRFLVTTLLATGAAGLPGVETLDSLIELATGQSLLEKIRDPQSPLLNRASRGLPGLTGYIPGFNGFDLSQNVGFGDYFSQRKLTPKFGPAVEEMKLLYNAITANPGRETKQTVNQLLRTMSPSGRRLWESFMSDAAQKDQIIDSRGRIIVKDVEALDKWLNAAGVTTLPLADQRDQYIRAYEKVRQAQSEKGGYVDAVADALREGNEKLALRLNEEAQMLGFTGVWREASRKVNAPDKTRLEAFQDKYRSILGQRTPAPPTPMTTSGWPEFDQYVASGGANAR